MPTTASTASTTVSGLFLVRSSMMPLPLLEIVNLWMSALLFQEHMSPLLANHP